MDFNRRIFVPAEEKFASFSRESEKERDGERINYRSKFLYRKRLDYASVANTKKVGTSNPRSEDSHVPIEFSNWKARRREISRFDFVGNRETRTRERKEGLKKETITVRHGKSPLSRYNHLNARHLADCNVVFAPFTQPIRRARASLVHASLNCSIRSFTYDDVFFASIS